MSKATTTFEGLHDTGEIEVGDWGDGEPTLVTSRGDYPILSADTAVELATAILRATGWSGELVLDDGPRIGL